MFLIDDSIGEDSADAILLYTKAYFHGLEVKIIRGGDEIQYTTSKGEKKVKSVPRNFIQHHKITMRDHRDSEVQANASEINAALAEYKVGNCFCILGITNVDLYPRPTWNFVYGLASPSKGTGVFSFYRHQENFRFPGNDMDPDEKYLKWLKRSCGTATHEIAHMFGLKHCIYYHCAM